MLGDIEIYLDYDHALPSYQDRFPQYDKFLPFLVGNLPSRGLVIDVGANVGDTVAAMVSSNPNHEYLCVEGNPLFFSELEANVTKIEEQSVSANIKVVNAVVAQNNVYLGFESNKGTARAVKTDCELESCVTLSVDSIVGGQDVAVLKSDVDGFDYDVINSAKETIKASRPLVFFEADAVDSDQQEEFKKTLQWLCECGYSFALFDNYGGLVVRECRSSVAIDFLDYAFSRPLYGRRRTIYYTDVFAYPSARRVECLNILDAYERRVG